MSPKRKTKSATVKLRAYTLRVASEVAQRIDRTAHLLGLDEANFLRMVIAEKLGEYEARAVLATKSPLAKN